MTQNKQLNNLLSAVILLCLTLALSTCKEKDCKKNGTCPAAYYWMGLYGAKDYLIAKPDSYWIYKNTKTGALDTQTCIGFSLDTFVVKGDYDYSKHVTIEYEKLSRTVTSSFNGWWESHRTNGFSANANDPSYYNIILERNASSVVDCFFYPFRPGVHAGYGQQTSYAGMDSVLILQGKTYFNVAKFDIDKDNIWDDKLSCIRSNNIYYWAKDVGLIKKEMKTCNSSWELIEYNIVK